MLPISFVSRGLLAVLFSLPLVMTHTSPLLAATDDDIPVRTGTPQDEQIWKKLDITGDGWLDGNELNGGWQRYDTDQDEEVTKEEFLDGRARERRSGKTAPAQAAGAKPAVPKQKVQAKRARPAVATRQAPAKATGPLARVKAPSPRRGTIAGYAARVDGSPLPSFTVECSGFQDGKLAGYSATGYAMETVKTRVKGTNGRYSIKVPPGAYRVRAYATYLYRGRTYHFELEQVNEPARHDYDGLGLDKLRNGLVRNFVLKMTEKKKGASEETESVYRNAYFGGRLEVDCRETNAILGGGHVSKTLEDTYPADSLLHISLLPQGPMVDGRPGKPVQARLRLGDQGKWTFQLRGVYPGAYSASARLESPDGNIRPLKISLQPAKWISGGQGGYDRKVMKWSDTVTVDFLPNDLGPIPRFGVNAVRIYLGE